MKSAKTELDFSDSEDEVNFSDQDSPKLKRKPKVKAVVKRTDPIIGQLPFINYLAPDASRYRFKDWSECFPDGKVHLWSLVFRSEWHPFFEMVSQKPYFAKIEGILSELVTGGKERIVPCAELLFNAFNTISPDDIRVVIMGQDPYFGGEMIKEKLVPQATGLSFSGPHHMTTPKSLGNIYKNLMNYRHMKKHPGMGCLTGWVVQGCFLINSALTTIYGQSNVHRIVWKPFALDLIDYLSAKLDSAVFLIWGKQANEICRKVDSRKHKMITSSHPSGYSVDSTFNGFGYGSYTDERQRPRLDYPAFSETDHFGRANQFLAEKGKTRIHWDLNHSLDWTTI